MSDKSFLSEQTKKELGDFLTLYMQGEPHSILVPRVEEIENPVMATLREQFERDNAQRKLDYSQESGQKIREKKNKYVLRCNLEEFEKSLDDRNETLTSLASGWSERIQEITFLEKRSITTQR